MVIPETAEIVFDTEVNPIGAIAYMEGNLEPDAYVTVELTAQTLLSNKIDGSYKIDYVISDADGVFTSVVYNEQIVTGTQTPLTVDITKEEWEEAKSGEYEARLTFTISYTNPHDAQDQPADEP